jgi:hypothetical protein
MCRDRRCRRTRHAIVRGINRVAVFFASCSIGAPSSNRTLRLGLRSGRRRLQVVDPGVLALRDNRRYRFRPVVSTRPTMAALVRPATHTFKNA